MTENRIEQIRSRLFAAFQPVEPIEVIDDSHLHAGHPGARDGRGHFRVRVVSAVFDGLKTLERHRKVYEAVGTLMQTDIHALNIEALTPKEATQA